MKNEVQKEKKKYKRKGQRKKVLFKDDEWEVVKKNAERMGLDSSKYEVYCDDVNKLESWIALLFLNSQRSS